jgi:ribonucleoside-diphosphate reductase alpha chain
VYEPTGFALEIFKARHAAHPEETWFEGCDRVAAHVANAEHGAARNQWRTTYYDALSANLLMPGGRIWYGSGRPRGQMLNCYITPTGDSREEWGKTVSDTIVISGTGGGVGINCSPVRPRGQPIRGTGGTATGAVSLMEIINAAGEAIKAGGGRRTALMLCLGLGHGDIQEFLDAKLDKGRLNNANVSVVFDDEPERFFDLVKRDGVWPLIHQGRQVGEIPARRLWDKIVKNALVGGEPGALNMYYANRMSNIWYAEKLISTNPCQPDWATVLTPEGIRTMANIDVGSIIWSGKQWTKVTNKTATGVKPVKAYRTRAGTFYGTENHRVVQNGMKIEARDAEAIDVCLGPQITRTVSHNIGDVIDGLVLGDGTYHAGLRKVLLCAGPAELTEYRAAFGSRVGEHRWSEKYDVTTSFDFLPLTYERKIPLNIFQGTSNQQTGFLRGLYTANGSVVANRITLKAASFGLIEQVQQMLASLGISSYVTVNKAHDVKHSNGVYTSRESYDLNIGTLTGRTAFANLIGFVQQHKTDRLNSTLLLSGKAITKATYDIVEVIDISEEEVFDITVDAPEHTYWTGGMLVSNCGEVTMSANECCCLGSLVLPRFVKDGEVDWSLLHQTVNTGVRFLDDVLTVNNYPLPEIQAKCNQLRRIGLGVMGLHHMLLELGLKYNAPSGLEFVDDLMKRIKNWSYEASSDLAAEKGSFSAFDADKLLRSGFCKGLKPSLREKIRKDGIRNCALNSIAPTGTISIVCGTSSGIEPIFAAAYERRYRQGDELMMETVVDPMFQRFVSEGRGVKHFVGAHDLSIRDHLEMQRVCQKHIDQAISKTINLPHGTSAEELSELYMEFLPELKGITVYPDGSRENQPLTPLPLDQAVNLAKNSKAGLVETGCKSGVCDL